MRSPGIGIRGPPSSGSLVQECSVALGRDPSAGPLSGGILSRGRPIRDLGPKPLTQARPGPTQSLRRALAPRIGWACRERCRIRRREELLRTCRFIGPHRLVPIESIQPRVGMSEQERTLRSALSWAARIGSTALMLFLIGVLAWVFSPPGGAWLPAGGAATGGLVGWRNAATTSGRIDTGLAYAVRGAALGLLAMFLYQSVFMPTPKEPEGRESKRERLVQAPSPRMEPRGPCPGRRFGPCARAQDRLGGRRTTARARSADRGLGSGGLGDGKPGALSGHSASPTTQALTEEGRGGRALVASSVG